MWSDRENADYFGEPQEEDKDPKQPAPDYKSEAGLWRLTSPSGTNYYADSPMKCLQAEQHDRIPASVAMARIWAAVDEGDAELAEERAAWRELVTRAAADANRYGLEGLHMRCTPSETGQLLSWEVVKPPNRC